MPGLLDSQESHGLLGKLAQTWPARMAQGLLSAAALPGDVYQGNVSMYGADGRTNPEVINRSADLAGMVMGGAYPAAQRGALGVGGGKMALPMDEASRMARATEQGYTIDAFKGGQPYDWNTMPATNWKGEVIKETKNRVPQEITSINSPNADYAGFFSNNPEVANRFAAPFEHGAVWPAKLKFKNPLVIDAKGQHAAAFQFDSIAIERGTQDLMQKFKGAFAKDSQHDGVILKNTKDEGDVYIPRNPDQIRSRFAKFDPASIGSGELLGGLAGIGMVGTALDNR